MTKENYEKVVEEIRQDSHKVIDDWCKAYMAQLYQEGHDIKPGCFTLCMQVPTYHKGSDSMVERYWFELGTPVFDDKPSVPWNETEDGKQRLLDLLNETYWFHEDGTITEKENERPSE